MKLYAVMSNNFQYNDEIYFIGEGDVGKVTKLYRKREKAEKECEKRMLSFFKDTSFTFGDFGYDFDDVFRDGWEKAFFKDEDEEKTSEVLEAPKPDPEMLMNLTRKDVGEFVGKYPKIVSYLTKAPFYVQELEVDD
jgi:hypothetical protein